MKFAMIFLLCCVAFVAAAPQLITYPGGIVTSGLATPFGRTVVAGPTVVNTAPYTRWGGLYGPWW